MIPVGWLDPSQDCWDSNMLRRLLDGTLYPHGVKVRHHAGYPNADGPVCLVVPGRYYAQHTAHINEAISRFVSVLMVVTSDEEALFPSGEIVHDRVRFWIQTPREGREYPEGARFIGVGFPPHFNQPPAEPPVKDTDVFLAAQRTNGRPGRHFKVHERRDELFKVLKRGGFTANLVERDGFAQGDRSEYVQGMLRAKVAPAPAGAVSCDSFRFWEALEAGAVPVADTVSLADGPTQYWRQLFADTWPVPWPEYLEAGFVPPLVTQTLSDWPAISNRVQAWWARYKRQLSIWLRDDLEALGAL